MEITPRLQRMLARNRTPMLANGAFLIWGHRENG
jgi:hypothetical protein